MNRQGKSGPWLARVQRRTWLRACAAGAVVVMLGGMDAAVAAPSFAASTRVLHPVAIARTQDGATAYEFSVAGKVNTFIVPPRGFSPLDATNAQLAQYGFPTRPTGAKQLQMWETAMSDWRRTAAPAISVTDVYSKLVPLARSNKGGGPGTASGAPGTPGAGPGAPAGAPGTPGGAAGPGMPAAPGQPHQRPVNATESSNWSGYYTSSGYNQWDAVEGAFVQPTDMSQSANKFESSWVGLGGVNSGALIQDGTQMNAGQYSAWYEYLGNGGAGVPEINFDNISVNPGDEIYAYTSYDASTGNAYFFVEDETDGTSQSTTVNLGSDYYDGSTAEWINERPEVGGSLAQLANYGSQTWTGAEAFDVTSNAYDDLGNVSNCAIDMCSSSGQLLSCAGSLQSPTSFTDTWCASGN